MLLQKHLQLAIRAHMGTSFTPEKRGEQYIKNYSDELASDMARVTELGGDANDYRRRYESLFVAWLSAKSRCLSSMITGPSGFPVRRAEKANQSERKHGEAFFQFRDKYFGRLERTRRREERAAADPVAEMQAKLARAERNQEGMKAANKIVQAKKLTPAEKVEQLVAMGFTEQRAAELLQPDFCGRIGFPAYMLTNNLANIKRMKTRLVELQLRAGAVTNETTRPDGIRIVENTEADRLQVFFPEKPSSLVIASLKKSGFKWSPSNGCWQRQLTDNAKWALSRILS